jgi:hypothetical protein
MTAAMQPGRWRFWRQRRREQAQDNEIAAELVVKESAVKAHVSRILMNPAGPVTRNITA